MDKELTRELKRTARAKLAYVKEHPLTEANAAILFSIAYDALRTALQSHASTTAFDPRGHDALIDHCHAIGFLDSEEAGQAHAFRLKRNNIEYRARPATIEQTRAITAFTERILERIGPI